LLCSKNKPKIPEVPQCTNAPTVIRTRVTAYLQHTDFSVRAKSFLDFSTKEEVALRCIDLVSHRALITSSYCLNQILLNSNITFLFERAAFLASELSGHKTTYSIG